MGNPLPNPDQAIFNYEAVKQAIDTVKKALPFLVPGPPLIHRDPGGKVHVDIPLMYNGFAIDRIHYDPVAGHPSPKGRPVSVVISKLDNRSIIDRMAQVLNKTSVIEAGEYRDPEKAWIIPLAWNNLIIAHVKVSSDGKHIIPDEALTLEISRRTL